jgi:hypothetical protein
MKNRKRIKFWSYSIVSLVSLLSCGDKDSGHLHAYKGLQELIIKIPDSIKPLNTEKDLKGYLTEHEQNIIIVLKSDCMNCILELDRWSQWAKAEELIRNSAIVIVIVNPITYLLEQEIANEYNYPFPIYTDPNNDFIEVNGLNLLELERLIILDQDSHIVFLGSPLSFPELNNSFFGFID